MIKRWFRLFISILLIAGFLVSVFNEDKVMMIFFVVAMILQELEDMHETLKKANP